MTASSLWSSADRATAEAIGGMVLPVFDRFLTGPPGSRNLPRRIRRLHVPNTRSLAAKGERYPRFRIPIAKITTPLGFSFVPDGWHPYVATLEAYAEEHPPPLRDTPLFRYYRRFTPRTVQEAILEDVETPIDPLAFWPIRGGLLSVWSLTKRTVDRALAPTSSTEPGRRQFIGPQSETDIREDIRRLRDLLDSIETQGYHPRLHPARPISGYFLVERDDLRFVCRHGNHRLAVLAHLGHDEVDVTIPKRVPPVVRDVDLEWWTTHRGGLFSPEVVEQLFLRLFHGTGRAKAANLGLLPRPSPGRGPKR